MTHFRSVPELFTALGGIDAIAAICQAPRNTVASWRHRRSIPARHWAPLVRSNQAITSGVTADEMAAAHAELSHTEAAE